MAIEIIIMDGKYVTRMSLETGEDIDNAVHQLKAMKRARDPLPSRISETVSADQNQIDPVIAENEELNRV